MSGFLFVTSPVTGHVVPLLPLARKLVERGHTVRWYTSARFQSRIEATGARFAPFRKARDVDYYNLMKFIIDINAEHYEDLLEIAEPHPTDGVVADAMAFAACGRSSLATTPRRSARI
jgi:hypothetical protein